MGEFFIPYDKRHLTLTLPDAWTAEVIAPAEMAGAPDPVQAVRQALETPVGDVSFADFAGVRSAAIAINDKTRPVPHDALLPPLLERLEALGLSPESTTLIIATGTHPPMLPEEFERILPANILARYPVICHDCDDQPNLVYLGETERGTPVWINRHFVEADIRIVVGNIEPHQFMGYSGGVKSAAIGLAGHETIDRNHALMTDPGSRLGHYHGNPARQDVEVIGRLADIHFALNAILNRQKQIVSVVAGEPLAVMEKGIPLAQAICQVAVDAPFDLVITSPGGYPKDLNLYQAQKALAHATLITKPGGTVVIVAACPEGTGSPNYERWMLDDGMTSYEAVFARFEREGFRAGPHKAFQIAQDAAKVQALLFSDMPPDLVRRLLLAPIDDLDEAVAAVLALLAPGARIGIMPLANVTVPVLPRHSPGSDS